MFVLFFLKKEGISYCEFKVESYNNLPFTTWKIKTSVLRMSGGVTYFQSGLLVSLVLDSRCSITATWWNKKTDTFVYVSCQNQNYYEVYGSSYLFLYDVMQSLSKTNPSILWRNTIILETFSTLCFESVWNTRAQIKEKNNVWYLISWGNSDEVGHEKRKENA